MTISQDDLNDLLAQVKAIHSRVIAADRYRMDGNQIEAGAKMLQLAFADLPGVMQILVRFGAVAEDGPRLADVPLHLLSTSANRDRLRVLVMALAVSKDVDRERGTGESGITHLLTTLAEMVRLEVEGPKGIGE